MKNKKDIRNEILKTRKAMKPEQIKEYSESICEAVGKTALYRNAEDVCLYMPVNNEVDVTYLMNMALNEGKHVWLPKVKGKVMDFHRYDGNVALVEGAFGIPEPDSEEMLTSGKAVVVIMPGAVFSTERDRIGYGGGYYDVFLEKNAEYRTIAVCYDFQIVDRLPAEKHDIKPEIIVSQSRVIM